MLSNCGSHLPRNDLRLSHASKPSTKSTSLAAKNPSKVQRLLRRQYEEWKGVRYRLGGTTKNGIDCSAFVRAAMKSGLGVNLPRTTELQTTIGNSISKSQLRPGDLVFFKTGFFGKRHVGIYMGSQVFLHASTSKGVMLSKLNSSYWIDHYWHSRRVID
jgi:lipoprotein Spr